MTTFYAAILLLPLADGMTLFFLNPCLTGGPEHMHRPVWVAALALHVMSACQAVRPAWRHAFEAVNESHFYLPSRCCCCCPLP